MRIEGASVFEYARQLDGRSWNPVARWTERRAPLLQLETDAGVIGIGEAWSRQDEIGRVLAVLGERVAADIVGARIESADAIRAIAGRYRPGVEGDADWALAAAASALDLALWDAWSRENEQPLWRALGGASNSVRVYASGGLYRDGTGPADLANEVRQQREAGFHDAKIKIGGAPLDDDIERVRAVRQGLGPSAELWVDAVNQLDPSTAVETARMLSKAGATAIQAPVPFSELAAMARIDAEALPVIAGEAEHRLDAFAALVECRAVSILQFNLGLCGGFSGAERIAALAFARGIPVTPQCHGTAVLQAASLHAGAALPGVRSVEYHRFHDHLHDALPAALRRVVDGTIAIGPESGLGIARLVEGAQRDGGTLECRARTGRV